MMHFILLFNFFLDCSQRKFTYSQLCQTLSSMKSDILISKLKCISMFMKQLQKWYVYGCWISAFLIRWSKWRLQLIQYQWPHKINTRSSNLRLRLLYMTLTHPMILCILVVNFVYTEYLMMKEGPMCTVTWLFEVPAQFSQCMGVSKVIFCPWT